MPDPKDAPSEAIREALRRFEAGSGDNNCTAAYKAVFALERRAEAAEAHAEALSRENEELRRELGR